MESNRTSKEEVMIKILTDLDSGKEPKEQNYGVEKQEYGDIVDMLKDSGYIKDAIVTRGGQGHKALFVDLSTAKITVPGLHYLESKKVTGESKLPNNTIRAKKVFVSQSGKDEVIVKHFIEKILINGMGFHSGDIFCSSQPGMKPEPGAKWTEEIKENIKGCDVVFMIITPYFKASEVCINEIGASWVLDKPTIILSVEPIKQDKATVLYSTSQVEDLLSEEGLDSVKVAIDNKRLTKEVNIDIWNRSKKDFTMQVKEYLSKHPFIQFENQKIKNKRLNDENKRPNKLLGKENALIFEETIDYNKFNGLISNVQDSEMLQLAKIKVHNIMRFFTKQRELVYKQLKLDITPFNDADLISYDENWEYIDYSVVYKICTEIGVEIPKNFAADIKYSFEYDEYYYECTIDEVWRLIDNLISNSQFCYAVSVLIHYLPKNTESYRCIVEPVKKVLYETFSMK